MPDEKGSVTPSTAAAATAASTALPPALRMSMPALLASRSTVAIAPPVPVAVGCLVAAGAAAGVMIDAMNTALSKSAACGRETRSMVPPFAMSMAKC
jgi:hypothetical protein